MLVLPAAARLQAAHCKLGPMPRFWAALGWRQGPRAASAEVRGPTSCQETGPMHPCRVGRGPRVNTHLQAPGAAPQLSLALAPRSLRSRRSSTPCNCVSLQFRKLAGAAAQAAPSLCSHASPNKRGCCAAKGVTPTLLLNWVHRRAPSSTCSGPPAGQLARHHLVQCGAVRCEATGEPIRRLFHCTSSAPMGWPPMLAARVPAARRSARGGRHQ